MEKAGSITRPKVRQSNLELLRILCVLAIIGDHFTGQNLLASFATVPQGCFYVLATSLSRVGCSVFVILSAWFSADLPFRSRKVVHVWLTVAMFSLPFLLWELTRSVFGEKQMQIMLYPLEESPLWFAGYYMVLMCLAPALNLLLKEGSRRLIEFILFFFGAAMVLYSTVTSELGFFAHDIWPMIFLYLLTGYWKKYRKVPTLSCACKWFFISWLGLSACRVISVYLPAGIGTSMFQKYMETYRARMQTLPNLVTAYSLFFLFYNLKIRPSALINRLAGLSLGVYCFHQLPGLYPILWEKVLRAPFHTANLLGMKRMAYTFAGVVVTWVLGCAAEFIRSWVSGALIENRNWFDRLCRRADRLINGEEETISGPDRKLIRWFIVILALWFMITPLLFTSQLYLAFRP